MQTFLYIGKQGYVCVMPLLNKYYFVLSIQVAKSFQAKQKEHYSLVPRLLILTKQSVTYPDSSYCVPLP